MEYTSQLCEYAYYVYNGNLVSSGYKYRYALKMTKSIGAQVLPLDLHECGLCMMIRLQHICVVLRVRLCSQSKGSVRPGFIGGFAYQQGLVQALEGEQEDVNEFAILRSSV